MASLRRRFKRSRALALDELGGTADGAVAIVVDDRPIHMAPHRVTAALRYFVARTAASGAERLPGCIAITSALRGEGVTYVTRSLAAVLAYDVDASVAIVDLNWTLPEHERKEQRSNRRAALPKSAGKSKGKPIVDQSAKNADKPDDGADDQGTSDDTADAAAEQTSSRPLTLADAVERDASLDDIVQQTSNPRLVLIPAGEVQRARRPAMARSRELEKVIREIAGRYDHVLLDLPPALASSDAITLAQLADAYTLVVRQGVTTTSQIQQAIDELSSCESLGIILNQFDTRVPRVLRKMIGA